MTVTVEFKVREIEEVKETRETAPARREIVIEVTLRCEFCLHEVDPEEAVYQFRHSRLNPTFPGFIGYTGWSPDKSSLAVVCGDCMQFPLAAGRRRVGDMPSGQEIFT